MWHLPNSFGHRYIILVKAWAFVNLTEVIKILRQKFTSALDILVYGTESRVILYIFCMDMEESQLLLQLYKIIKNVAT